MGQNQRSNPLFPQTALLFFLLSGRSRIIQSKPRTVTITKTTSTLMNDNVLQTADIDDLLLLYLVQRNTKKIRRVLVQKKSWNMGGVRSFLDAFIWVNINYPAARQRGHIRTKQTTSVPKTISHNVSNIRITDWLPCKFRWILISCQCLKGIPTISCATIVVVLVVVWTILIFIDFVLGVDGPWGRCTPVMAVVVVVRGSWWSVWEYF